MVLSVKLSAITLRTIETMDNIVDFVLHQMSAQGCYDPKDVLLAVIHSLKRKRVAEIAIIYHVSSKSGFDGVSFDFSFLMLLAISNDMLQILVLNFLN